MAGLTNTGDIYKKDICDTQYRCNSYPDKHHGTAVFRICNIVIQ